jgi:hypothetical protein
MVRIHRHRSHGLRVNSNWAVVKLNTSRGEINQVPFPFSRKEQNIEWVPRDTDGMYVTGVKELQVYDKIMKSGQSTGCTTDKIELVTPKPSLKNLPKLLQNFASCSRQPEIPSVCSGIQELLF